MKNEAEKARETHPLILALAVLLAVCALGGVFFREDMREYYLYFTELRPSLSFDFDDMSEDWDEARLHAFFEGYSMLCQSETEEVEALGDRTCFIDIQTYNSVPAMSLAFFFSDGKLNFARVAIPFWAHSDIHAAMVKDHGPPSFYRGAMAEEDLDAWRLENGGAVFLNRDPVLNPVAWHQLLWTSKRACMQVGC